MPIGLNRADKKRPANDCSGSRKFQREGVPREGIIQRRYNIDLSGDDIQARRMKRDAIGAAPRRRRTVFSANLLFGRGYALN